MQISSFIESVKQSAASKKRVAEAIAMRDNLMQIVLAVEPSRSGRVSQLSLAADEAEQAFYNCPSVENAEALHNAIIRHKQAEESFPRIDACIHRLFPGVAAHAMPAANEILDAAIAGAKAEAEKARATACAGAFNNAEQVDAQLASVLLQLESQRTAIMADPLSWLQAHGFA